MKYVLLLIFPFIFLISCGSDEDKQRSKSFDSLKTALEKSAVSDTSDNNTSPQDNFDNLLSEFGKLYSISPEWNKLNKNNRNNLKKELSGKFIIVPITKTQITGILNSGFSDTSIVFTGASSNAFVFDIDASPSALERIGPGKNGLILLKIKKIDDSIKLYLKKKGKDFQYSESIVTEFIITCDLVESAAVTINDSLLLNKFGLEEF